MTFSSPSSRWLAGALAGLIVPWSLSADDWTQWRGPKRDGISAESGWNTSWPSGGPKKLWEKKVGVGYSSMSVAGGKVYTMGNTENTDSVSCLDAETGAQVWKHDYPCNAKDPNGYHGTRCTPTVDGGLVYTLSRHGHLFCLDAESGAIKWAKNVIKDFGGSEPVHSGGKSEGWGYAGSPLVEKDIVYLEIGGTSGASVIALKKQTGELVWKNGNDIAGYSSLIAFDLDSERCIAQFAGDGLVVRRMKDGSEVWRHPWKTSYGVNASTPIIHDNKIFVSSGYGFGCALIDARSGKELWRNKNMRNHVNSCVLVNGYLYGFDDSELKCLDWNSGEVKWGNRSYGKGSLIVAGGKLILHGGSGKVGLAEANPNEFKEISAFNALEGKDTWASPVLANGRLYVRNLNTLAAFDLKK